MHNLLNNTMTCKNLENFAFGTHVDCYLNPGYGSKSICDIWASQNAVGLLTTYELQDFFKNFTALSQVSNKNLIIYNKYNKKYIIQVFSTMTKCVIYYGSNSMQFLLNAISGIGNLIGQIG